MTTEEQVGPRTFASNDVTDIIDDDLIEDVLGTEPRMEPPGYERFSSARRVNLD